MKKSMMMKTTTTPERKSQVGKNRKPRKEKSKADNSARKQEKKSGLKARSKTSIGVARQTLFSLFEKDKPEKTDKDKEGKERDKEKDRERDKDKERTTDKKTNRKDEQSEEDKTENEMHFYKEPDRPVLTTLSKPTDAQKEAYLAFAKNVCAQGVQGLLAEWAQQVKPYLPSSHGREAFDQNPTKNRYKDVVCNDLTRVVLSDGRGSDYIHANFVRGDPLYNEFICTQGPMPETVIDFWRMVVVTKARNIIMLCEVVELGKVKCEQYWPTKKGDKMNVGDFVIENAAVKSTNPSSSNAHITKSHLVVTRPGGTPHHVLHHHWKNWPDRSAPRSGKGVLRVLREVRCSARPTIVHCSAGIGRTGTLVAIEMCLLKLVNTNQLCLIDMCKRLRDQRMSCIQVDSQYAYLAFVVLEYGKALHFIQDSDDLKKFKSDMEALLADAATAAAAAASPAVVATPVTPPATDAAGAPKEVTRPAGNVKSQDKLHPVDFKMEASTQSVAPQSMAPSTTTVGASSMATTMPLSTVSAATTNGTTTANGQGLVPLVPLVPAALPSPNDPMPPSS